MTTTTRTPLTGHTSPETAYLVADYPYGRKVRCRIRYWMESDDKRGFRFVSQTEHPTRKVWNAPKKSTYSLLAGAMYLDEQNHVQWTGLSEYDDHAAVAAFLAAFPPPDAYKLLAWCIQKAAYYAGNPVWRINGEASPPSPHETESNAADAVAWRALVTTVRGYLPAKASPPGEAPSPPGGLPSGGVQ